MNLDASSSVLGGGGEGEGVRQTRVKTRSHKLFKEGEGKDKEENHPYVVASRTPLNGDLAGDPGMCPD